MNRSGQYRTCLVVQECTQTPDGSGGRATEWHDVGKIRASVMEASSFEVFRAARQNTIITHMIETRFTRLVDEKSRLLLRTKDGSERTFQVVNVNNIKEKNRKLRISAKESR